LATLGALTMDWWKDRAPGMSLLPYAICLECLDLGVTVAPPGHAWEAGHGSGRLPHG